MDGVTKVFYADGEIELLERWHATNDSYSTNSCYSVYWNSSY